MLFALAVAVGIGHGPVGGGAGHGGGADRVAGGGAVGHRAGGMAADRPRHRVAAERAARPRQRSSRWPTATGFAVAVLVIMLAEQTFLNAGPLLVKATEGGVGRGARRASPSTCC